MAEVFREVEPVEIISPSRTLLQSGSYKGRTVSVCDSVTVTQPPTFGVKSGIGRILSILFTQVWLFFYLLFHTKYGEKVIIYHSLSYMGTIRFLKRLKRWNLVLEIREIYSDVKNSYSEFKGNYDKTRIKELRYFSIADSYIFPTELLNDLINTNQKPYLIATAIYKPETITENKFDDGKIHVVYAGTLRVEKGGAIAAVMAGELVSRNYHVHVLGYGSESDIQAIKELVKGIDAQSLATVTYDGLLRGDEFKRFLQRCHIGLSPQNPDGSFNDTSFPSKVLTYLANGLDVLSVRIPAVETSPVGDFVHYYDNQTPQEIAAAVMKIIPGESSAKIELLQRLDKELKHNFSVLWGR